MDDNQTAAQSAATKEHRAGLAKNSLNLPRLAFIGLAYFSLAPVIYLNMGFMETDSGGPVMPFLYHARFHRQDFNWFLNGFIPVAGIAIDGYVLYKGFFVSEISLPFKSGSSIVWFSLAWAVIGIFWALWWARRRHLASISLSAEV